MYQYYTAQIIFSPHQRESFKTNLSNNFYMKYIKMIVDDKTHNRNPPDTALNGVEKWREHVLKVPDMKSLKN